MIAFEIHYYLQKVTFAGDNYHFYVDRSLKQLYVCRDWRTIKSALIPYNLN